MRARRDNFTFEGLDSWFDRHFEPYHLFGYIGDQKALTEYRTTKSVFRQTLEAIGPKISLPSVNIAGINLGLSNGESEVAKKIIDIINEAETKRQINEFLKEAQDQCSKEGRSFNSIGIAQKRGRRKHAITTAVPAEMQNRLVVVEAQLINRGTVKQYASDSAQQLQASKEEWLLSDFPPHGLVKDNPQFKGDLLRLKEDNDFSDTFAEYLPFARRIGWYPYCRITGFYDLSTLDTEVFPRMSICLVEYRPPQLLQKVEKNILEFLSTMMLTKDPLGRFRFSLSERTTAAYILPIVTARSRIKDYKVKTSKSEVEEFVNSLEDDLPITLKDWYQQALA
jgi:hypothetical protein